MEGLGTIGSSWVGLGTIGNPRVGSGTIDSPREGSETTHLKISLLLNLPFLYPCHKNQVYTVCIPETSFQNNDVLQYTVLHLISPPPLKPNRAFVEVKSCKMALGLAGWYNLSESSPVLLNVKIDLFLERKFLFDVSSFF